MYWTSCNREQRYQILSSLGHVQALESKEKTRERDARVAAAILEYRKKQGLFVDPEEEAKWTAAYTRGLELMQVCLAMIR